jgi:hypothetical protein
MNGTCPNAYDQPNLISITHSFMASYDDSTLNCIVPRLLTGERKHIFVVQDETVFHTNEYRQHMWLTSNQQPIQKKGHRQAIHVSDFISETIRQIKLSKEQITNQLCHGPALGRPLGACGATESHRH